MTGMERYQRELKKQLGFLRRSCRLYDEGEVEEAIRIAVTIRTMIHDTNRSTSLLTHLNAKGIKLWSSVHRNVTEGTLSYHGMGMHTWWREGNRAGGSYGPSFDEGPGMLLLPVSEWWNQIVYVFSRRPKEDPTGGIQVTRLSRRDIVWTATNKDGGAHVDEKLTPAYEMLAKDGAVGSFRWGEQIIPITKAHLVTLRQIGHEVLRSLGGEQAPVEPVVQEFGPFEEPLVGHTLQEFKPLGGDPSWATLYMRCGTVAGPGPEGWRELCVKVTPVDTEIGIYSFICPYCKGELVWDPRELRAPQEIEAIRNRMRSSGQAHKA
jgi:hypothetical protein